MAEAIEWADAQPAADPESLLDDVYAEAADDGEVKFWQAVNAALGEELERDPTVVHVRRGRRQGGRPVRRLAGLRDRFGETRVRDTPIAEGAITGVAVGAAMSGLRPVVEIMFFDFVTLAMDQLVNQAAKMRYMSGGKLSVPMVLHVRRLGARLGAAALPEPGGVARARPRPRGRLPLEPV